MRAQRALGTWPKISFCSSGNFQWRMEQQFAHCRKEHNLTSYGQISENFLWEISIPFNFHPEICRIFGWMVHILEILELSDFLETFQENFPCFKSSPGNLVTFWLLCFNPIFWVAWNSLDVAITKKSNSSFICIEKAGA